MLDQKVSIVILQIRQLALKPFTYYSYNMWALALTKRCSLGHRCSVIQPDVSGLSNSLIFKRRYLQWHFDISRGHHNVSKRRASSSSEIHHITKGEKLKLFQCLLWWNLLTARSNLEWHPIFILQHVRIFIRLSFEIIQWYYIWSELNFFLFFFCVLRYNVKGMARHTNTRNFI